MIVPKIFMSANSNVYAQFAHVSRRPGALGLIKDRNLDKTGQKFGLRVLIKWLCQSPDYSPNNVAKKYKNLRPLCIIKFSLCFNFCIGPKALGCLETCLNFA